MRRNVKLTIGLMVYNEIDYIGNTIKNILDQPFSDFELLVGDNASTDGSSEMIAQIAKLDNRIVHLKRRKNIGALQNWNDVVEQAKGKYFILAGGHDLLSPDYLPSLVDALNKHPDAALAFTKSQWIDKQGNKLDIPTTIVATRGTSRLGRFALLMFAWQHYLYALMRTEMVKKTRKQLEIIGSGEIFLQELVQLGDFIFVENETWYRRKVRNEEVAIKRLQRYQNVLFSSSDKKKRFIFFPHLQMMFAYLALPFKIKSLPLKNRVSFSVFYPLILFRFSRTIHIDFVWLAKNMRNDFGNL